MTVYWADPFLEATTQGNGTTDTTTRDGTYAAPFSLHNDLISTSSSNLSSVNGVSLANGDEIRIKGLPFATLFETQGNVYAASTSVGLTGELKPITGNTTFDATMNNTYPNTDSQCYAFQNSDISSYLPGWSHPLFFTANKGSDSTKLVTQITAFITSVFRLQEGYSSASSTGVELFRLKSDYTYIQTINSYRYLGNFANTVKLSAGWTSTTAQDGYSIFEAAYITTFERFYVGGGSGNTYFDLGRLACFLRTGVTGSEYGRVYLDPVPCTDGGTGTVTMPMVAGRLQYGANIYSASSNIDAVFPLIAGTGYSSSGRAVIYHLTDDVMRFDNLLGNQANAYASFTLQQAATGSQFKIGNMYSDGILTFNGNFPFNYLSVTYSPSTWTFLQDSVYFIIGDDTSKTIYLAGPDDADTTNVYETGLKRPGLSPLASVSNDTYGPDVGVLIDSGSDLFKEDITFSASTEWFEAQLARSGSNPIVYNSLGKLICGGSNYKTSAHNLATSTGTAASATGAPRYAIHSFEHNDYDGNPVSIIGDPYTAGTSYGVLMYNDTVSSTNVLVGQWAGTTGGSSSQAWIPLELSVPSYTAASDNLRAKVTVAYADGASNTADGSVLLRAWHRDTTQSTNFRVYSSSATTVTAGGDPTSTTEVTLNLSNVATSGQDDITSVLLGIRLDFTDNTNIQKYYIVSAEIETYGWRYRRSARLASSTVLRSAH